MISYKYNCQGKVGGISVGSSEITFKFVKRTAQIWMLPEMTKENNN